MKFSVIVPSYNQDRFIAKTLSNLKRMKQVAKAHSCELEILLFDSESNAKVQAIIAQYKDDIHVLEIKKDMGQFDAINKGIVKCTGTYWTWLNTDDLLEEEGFVKTIQHLKQNASVDYIYGSIQYINADDQSGKVVKAWPLSLQQLVSSSPSIFQPGSWFRKEFTNTIGLLSAYQCCFDYEYICRLLKQNARLFCLNEVVAQFRYYPDSKSGSIMKKFVEEQWTISKNFGRKWLDSLTWMLALRRVKHFLFS
jgi:glycosyltransferase involved in cell wall biosynthesis